MDQLNRGPIVQGIGECLNYWRDCQCRIIFHNDEPNGQFRRKCQLKKTIETGSQQSRTVSCGNGNGYDARRMQGKAQIGLTRLDGHSGSGMTSADRCPKTACWATVYWATVFFALNDVSVQADTRTPAERPLIPQHPSPASLAKATKSTRPIADVSLSSVCVRVTRTCISHDQRYWRSSGIRAHGQP